MSDPTQPTDEQESQAYWLDKDGKHVKKIPREKIEPDWTTGCASCGAKPVVPITGLCGPCTFGEAETSGGNW